MSKPNGRVEVVESWNQMGWTGRDHQIPVDLGLGGKTYASAAGAARAAQRAAKTWPGLKVRDADGAVWRYDGSPTSIPGRAVRVWERIA